MYSAALLHYIVKLSGEEKELGKSAKNERKIAINTLRRLNFD